MKVLIVGKDAGERMRIKSLLKEMLSRVVMDGALSAQEIRLNVESPLSSYQLLFVSLRIGDEELLDIVSQCTAISPDFSRRIVLTVPALQQQGNTIKQWIEKGIGGFLFEPVSSEQLTELIGRVLQNVVEHRAIDPGSVSIKTDIIEAVDIVDTLYRAELTGKLSSSDKKRMTVIKPNLSSHFNARQEEYVDALVELFAGAKPVQVRNSRVIRKAPAVQEASHPGYELTKLLIKRHIDPQRAAGLIGITEAELKELCGGRTAVTEEIADRIARGFGGTKQTWLDKQKKYDDWIVYREQSSLTAK